ncbi:flagellar hook protein FlgE [Marinibacterium profundimaris]|nr:flagellar hook-basal body complex protein [Marinibacterium profundimaris]
MSMSSSLNAGVSGLQSNSTQLSAISENIANGSTFGYKRVETSFNAMVMGSGAAYTAGGVAASTTRLIDESGALVSTKNPTDIAISGRGFVPTTWEPEFAAGGSDMLLSRGDSFRINEDGYLATETGLLLMGWPANQDGTIPNYPRDTADGLEPIQFSLNLSGDPTTSVAMSLNLPAVDTETGASGEPHELTVEYFDNLGRSQSITMTFTPTVPATGTSNEWTVVLTDSAQPGVTIGEYVMTFEDSRTAGGTLQSVATTTGGPYDPVDGTVLVNVAAGPIEIDIGAVNDPFGVTQLSDSFAPISITKDGSPVGNMVSVEIDENGMVNVLYDTGVTDTLYQVPLINVPNPNGLVPLNQQTYRPSNNSGSYFLWDAGDGPVGTVSAYAREGSNVDIASELTDMIQTQRAYSSNAKVIQTVDEMLQETTNIKR